MQKQRSRVLWLLAATAVPTAPGACARTSAPSSPSDPAPSAPPSLAGTDRQAVADPRAPGENGRVDPALEPAEPRTRPAPSVVETRAAALEAVSHQNPEGARDFLRTYVAEHKTDAQARHALARAHLLLGELAEVRSALEPANPQDITAIRLRAESLRRAGDLAAATRALQSASLRNPAAMPLRGDLITLLVAQGLRHDPGTQNLIDGLYDDYEAGLAATPADLFAVAQATLGRGTKGAFHDANMVLGEAEDAAMRKAPDGWDLEAIVLRRADMFREKYAAQDALQTLAIVLEGRNPWHPDALASSARVHADNLAFATASRLANEALQVDSGHPGAHAVLARVALIEGRRDEARTRVEQHVLRRNPGHTSGLAVLAALAIVRKRDADYRRWRSAALAVNPRHGAFYAELADVLGFLHLYPETDAVLADGTAQAPNDPRVHAARGLNLLRLGKEAEARNELERAWTRDPFNERTRNTLDLYENRIDPLYGDRAVGDLVLRLPNDHRALVEPPLLDAILESRRALDAAYRTQVGALRLEFFAEPSDFSIRTVGVPSLGAVAVCFGPVITFLGPYSGRFNLENVIRHELAHVYAIRLSEGRVPRWFTEGLSEWESELANPAFARESAELLASAHRAGKLRSLRELELAFVRAESPQMMEVAYATAAYAIRYLGTTYGRDALIDMLRGYAAGEHTETLMKIHLGKSMAAVQAEFETWFFGQLDAVFTGWQPQPDPSQSHDPRDALLDRARSAVRAGDSRLATSLLEDLLRRGGDGYVARMMLAKLADPSAPSPTVVRHLEAARASHTEAVEPLVMLANLARQEGRTSAEMRHLTAALAIDGDAFEPAARLLMLAAVTQDSAAGQQALRRARAIAPLHPSSLAGQALAEHQAGNLAGARELAHAAATRARGLEGPVDTLVVVALAAHAVGDVKAARALAGRARAGGPLPPAAQRRLDELQGLG